MIVALDLERDGHAVADVDDTRVLLARADEDLRRLGRERFEQRLGVFVGAMLAPHHAEDPQLGVIRSAAKNLNHPLILLRREVVLLDQLRRDGRFGHREKSGGLGAGSLLQRMDEALEN